MNISFIDLKSQYISYKAEIDSSIQKVLDSTQFILGKEVQILEENLANFTGSQHCIACSSGTDALLLSLLSINIKPDDEVITTPFTFISTAEVITLLGAKPVFVDIDEKSYNIDANKIEEKINKKTKAIIPVSLYGQTADFNEINSIADKYQIPVIEDGCQSFGAEYKGNKSCNLSTIGCTSFFPSKPLGCYGDGGAIFTNNSELVAKIRSLLNHGQTQRYEHKYIGINGRLDTIQAAILNVKLKYFKNEIEQRQRIARRYYELLKNKNYITTPFIKSDRTSIYAQYSIRVKDREKIIDKLTKMNIPTAIHYPKSLHLQKAFEYLMNKEGDFPISEKISKEILSLPMSAFLTEEQQNYIVDNI